MMEDEVLIVKDTGEQIEAWVSENAPMTEGCDACVGYQFYDATGREVDGGEIDCNEVDLKYGVMNFLEEILSLASESLVVGFSRENITISFNMDELPYGWVA